MVMRSDRQNSVEFGFSTTQQAELALAIAQQAQEMASRGATRPERSWSETRKTFIAVRRLENPFGHLIPIPAQQMNDDKILVPELAAFLDPLK